MKCIALALCALAAASRADAQVVVPLWPSSVPAGRQGPVAESSAVAENLVGGRPWTYIRNVSVPTLTVYSPARNNTGAAVIVFPGGGYQILAIDLEGTEVCDWLTAKGITCVVSKYRVPNNGPSWDERSDLRTHSSKALEDAQRTISLVRARAAEWHIDPRKIGVLGFSAGGHIVAATSTRFNHRVYAPVDAADSESCRPDFAVALYPGHLFDARHSRLYSDIHVTRDTPPTFLVQAENDNVDDPGNSLSYYEALKDAGVPAELHIYAEGRHAFVLRPTQFPITRWPRLVETWLRSIGMVPPEGR